MESAAPPRAVSLPHLVRHERFASRHLERQRDVVVYLPPGYDQERGRRYPARAGWREDVDLASREVSSGTHTERAWADRVGDVLQFLGPGDFGEFYY